jgi:hypothetical protein
MILRLSKLASPAVVERTSVPESVPDPVARMTVIEYLEDWLLVAKSVFENSSRIVTSGTKLNTSPSVLFSVWVVGTLVRVSELGIPYSGVIPSTVEGVKLPLVWLNVRVEAGEFRARFPEITLLAARLIVPPA